MGIVDRLALALGFERAAPATLGARWLWPSNGNGDRGPPGNWQMNRNGPNLGIEQMAFSAVYACVNVISSDLAKLPFIVNKVDLETGARTRLPMDYYAGLLRSPNSYQTSSDFVGCFVQSYLLQGNAYAFGGKRNGRGEIQELHVLNPYRVTPLIGDDGSVFYRCGEDVLAGIRAETIVPERDMIHHRLPLVPGYPLVGVTPIFAAAASSAVGLKILQNSQQFFANSSRPAGSLNAPGKISKETADRLAQDWDSNYTGERFGKTAVLPEGLKWEPLTITAQDAQLIEQLRYSVEDVARVFRVPLYLLGDMTKVTYRNVETLFRVFVVECLGFHLTAIESRLERAFEFPPTYELRFDLTAALRTEIDVRYAAYQTALNAGWQSINEVRAAEGLDPVDGGDEPRVQMQYVPLSQANGPPAPAAPPVPADDPSKAFDRRRVRRMVAERLRGAA
jgi:HK97 family phage portal protein